jgi:leucyl-tRNA synthetase
MGPLDKAKPWSETGLQGCSRFLNKILRLIIKDNEINANINEDAANDETIKLLHQTIKKVTYDIENLDFNTAISQMMIFTNHLITQSSINRKIIESFTLLLNPFVPHVAEEIWNKLGHTKSITYESWPNYDQNLIIEELMTIAVQVNGKLRASIEIDANADKDLIIQTTKENEKISQYLDTKEILNEIYVTGRLVNFVIK